MQQEFLEIITNTLSSIINAFISSIFTPFLNAIASAFGLSS